MFDIGFQELILIFVVALLVFGPKNLPQLGRSLGRAMREFRRASDEFRSTIETNLQINEPEPTPSYKAPEPPVVEGAAATGAAEGLPDSVLDPHAPVEVGTAEAPPRAAFDHLRALERKGMLQRRVTDKRVSRTLVLTDRSAERSRREREIPILGKIAAGAPIFAVENREDVIPVRPEWLASKGGDVFALRVRGDSMIEAHIADGDLVLVRKQEFAAAGDIVAAMIDQEATVKR